jgi:hypothetical protein
MTTPFAWAYYTPYAPNTDNSHLNWLMMITSLADKSQPKAVPKLLHRFFQARKLSPGSGPFLFHRCRSALGQRRRRLRCTCHAACTGAAF